MNDSDLRQYTYCYLIFIASLREWAIKQKKTYHENKLSKERISQLKKCGFDFMPIKEHNYEDSFKELEMFKAEHGHTNVPPSYKENPQLARWVEIQVRISIACVHVNVVNTKQ